MNVDIFTCVDFREFAKVDNVAWIYIAFLILLPLNRIIQVIFTVYIFLLIFEKCE